MPKYTYDMGGMKIISDEPITKEYIEKRIDEAISKLVDINDEFTDIWNEAVAAGLDDVFTDELAEQGISEVVDAMGNCDALED